MLIRVFLFILFAGVIFSTQLFAQGTEPPKDDKTQAQPQQQRPNLFRALGLTEEQRKLINDINTNVRAERNEANKRLRDANRELDRAVYADVADDSEIAAKLKVYQDAQADVARIRFETELAVRRLLTAEQLLKFREIRQRFNQRHENQPPPRPEEKRHDHRF